MSDLFSNFLADPSGENFIPLREALMASPSYDFHATDVDEIVELIEAGKYRDVSDVLASLMPNWLLSPRVHRLASYAAGRAGDEDCSKAESYLAQACLRGLLRSGDGTRQRPYRVTHIADEYDLLEYLGKEMAEQSYIVGADGAFDRLVCADGSEIWFDIKPGQKVAL